MRLLPAVSFFAISDDDYSRLVIAQDFAHHPSLDPSGTSWLPLPFITYGSVFSVFGNTLAVASTTALVLRLLGFLGIWVAARFVGLGYRAALLGVTFAFLLPHASDYARATVPDFPTAVLSLIAVSSLAAKSNKARLSGAFAALAASLCRYEAWPIAFLVSAFALRDAAAKHRNPALLVTAAAAPAGAIAWMLHGQVTHRDAFFFIKRVAQYKRALGLPDVPILSRLVTQPLALFRGEPELFVATVALLAVAFALLGKRLLGSSPWQRPTLALLSVLGFLVVGDLRDGSPTHHGDRVLLSLWLGMALLNGYLVVAIAHHVNKARPSRVLLVGLVSLLGLLVATTNRFVRPLVVPIEPYVDRSREVAMGQLLREKLPESARVAVYTADYGYFAMDAALGRPRALVPLHKRDPRHPEVDPLQSSDLLATRLSQLGTRYWVVPAMHQTQASAIGTFVGQTAGFQLFFR